MTSVELVALSPLLVLGLTTVIVMLVIAIYRNHLLTLGLTLLGLALSGVAVMIAVQGGDRNVTPLLAMDRYTYFYMGLLLILTFAIALLAHGYLVRRIDPPEEFYVLLLLATLGAMTLTASRHFASFFLGLELLSVSLYAMIAYQRLELSIEAGLKYLVLAAVSASFLLLGMAFVYADRGTMVFSELTLQPVANPLPTSPVSGGYNRLLLMGGAGLMLIGIGFKLALVPFHMWVPDVYEGASAPVTAFVATVSKASVVAVLLRLFAPLDVHQSTSLFVVLSGISILSMFGGNLLALMQHNVKRMLAYSSIAHLGYLLVAFLSFAPNQTALAPQSGPVSTMAGAPDGVAAATFYLVTYTIAILAAFGVVSVISGDTEEAGAYEDYRAMFWRRPGIAFVLTMVLLSLASIPLTAGFVGKIYVLVAGIGSGLWVLAISLVVSSAIGLYYYARLIVTMFQRSPRDSEESAAGGTEIVEAVGAVGSAGPAGTLASVPWSGGAVLGVFAILLIWLGTYPAPLLSLIQALTSVLGGTR